MRSFISNNSNIQGDDLNYHNDDHHRNLHHEDMSVPPENAHQEKAQGSWKEYDLTRQNKYPLPPQSGEINNGPYAYEINNTLSYPVRTKTFGLFF
jgi:hypothetical protein